MILVIFTQCASSQKMETNAPVTVKSPYFEKWYDLDDAGCGYVWIQKVYLIGPNGRYEEI